MPFLFLRKRDITAAQTSLEETIVGAVQDAVNAITAQLGKAKTEVLAKIADLEAQVAAGETVDLEPLKTAAQALDDVVSDAVPEPPVEEPPVDETPR